MMRVFRGLLTGAGKAYVTIQTEREVERSMHSSNTAVGIDWGVVNFITTQSKFKCVECGFAANADFAAACNIREAGLRLLSLSQSSGDVSPSCEEPTEGIQV
jgi:transposase